MNATLFKNKLFSLPFFAMFIVIALVFVITQNTVFWREVYYQMTFDSVRSYLFVASIFIVLMSVMLILLSLFLWSKLRWPAVILLLFLCTIFNYYSYHYQIYMDRDMLTNIVETNSGEMVSLLRGGLFIWLLLGVALPLFLLAKVDVKPIKWWKGLLQRLMLIGVALGLIGGVAFVFYKDYASFFRNNRQVLKLVMPMSYIASGIAYMEKSYAENLPFQTVGEDAILLAPEGKKKTVFLMVVGETARSQNFSLNGYQKETNPLLSKQSALTSFRHVASCGTATAISVPCMFSLLTRETFNKNSVKNQENLLDIVQRAGYQVLWRENDGGCKGVCDRVPTQHVEDYTLDPKTVTGLYYDENLLLNLREYMTQEENADNLMIVLHMNGSHGPAYYQRYPKAFEKFTPSCDTNRIESCSAESLENVYDNTLVYTDYVLNNAIEVLRSLGDEYETSLLYVSDHGESLGEDRFYLHGAPYLIAPSTQTQVPMIFWGNDSFFESRHLDQDCLNDLALHQQYSHDNIFHSLLGILSVGTKVYDHSMDIFKECQNR